MSSPWVRRLPAPLRARIEGSPTLQRIVPNAGWMVADRLVRMALGLVVGAWVARYLGPSRFGGFNFALAFVALFSPLATLGIERIVVRDLVDHPDADSVPWMRGLSSTCARWRRPAVAKRPAFLTRFLAIKRETNPVVSHDPRSDKIHLYGQKATKIT
jgi:hypothetical protein